MKSPGSRKIRSLDVRPHIARGEEPFQQIMATIAALAPDESFRLTAPFLPSPLIEKLRSEGFVAHPERLADGSWRTHFVREGRP